SYSSSPHLENRELDLIIERFIADHGEFPVVEEVPVVRDVESRAGSDGDVGRLLPVLEGDDQIAVGVQHEIAEGDIVWPEIVANRQVCEVRRLGGRLAEQWTAAGRDPSDRPLVVLVQGDVHSRPATYHPRTARVAPERVTWEQGHHLPSCPGLARRRDPA